RLLVLYNHPLLGRRGSDDALRVWEVATASEVLTLPTVLNARVAFSRDGHLLAMGTPFQKILLWDLRQGRELRRLTGFAADLNSDQFAVREEAAKELEAVGETAAGALRAGLAEKSSLEARRRVERLLEKLRGPVTRPETLRALRAVAVLEDIGSAEARQILT